MADRGGRDDEDVERPDIALLRLECPFCHAEYPLWLRPERDLDETLPRAEWELWLDRRCDQCGRTPREHLTP